MRTLIVLQDLRPDDLVDGVCGHLIDEVPQLHVRLLGLRRVLVGYRTPHCKLFVQLGLGLRKVTDFFNSVLHQRLIRLE